MTLYLKPRATIGTSAGLIRELNEDSAHVSISPTNRRPASALLILADGLIGLERDKGVSRNASQLVVATIHDELQDLLQQQMPASEIIASHLVERLHLAVARANEALCVHEGKCGVVTGLACVLVRNQLAVIVNYADCRVYLLRSYQLRLISDNLPWATGNEDPMSSYGAVMGKVTAVQINRWTHWKGKGAEFIRQANSRGAVQLNVWTESLQARDRLLLCSDGLWGLLDDSSISLCLRESNSPKTAVQQLIDAANANGGPDNITAIVCDIDAE